MRELDAWEATVEIAQRSDPSVGLGDSVIRVGEMFSRACKLGSRDGCFDLGLVLSGEIEGGPTDDAAAASAFDAGCQRRHAASCSMLGFAYLEGTGVEQDRQRGMALVRQGCKLGDKNACNALKKMGWGTQAP